MEHTPQNKQCPKCGQGEMKMVVPANPLIYSPKMKPMQARCNQCGFEDDYTKIYPFER